MTTYMKSMPVPWNVVPLPVSLRLDPVRQRLPCRDGCGLQSVFQRNPFTRQVTLAHFQGWCLQLFWLLVNCWWSDRESMTQLQSIKIKKRALQKATTVRLTRLARLARLHRWKIRGSDFNLARHERVKSKHAALPWHSLHWLQTEK